MKLIVFLMLAIFAVAANAQERRRYNHARVELTLPTMQFIDRIIRPCAAGAVPRAEVVANPNSSGNVVVTTCTGGALVVNGTSIPSAPVSGSGTTNTITKWTNGVTRVIGDSQITDDGTNIAIGPLASAITQIGGGAASGFVANNTDTAIGDIGSTANGTTIAVDDQSRTANVSAGAGMVIDSHVFQQASRAMLASSAQNNTTTFVNLTQSLPLTSGQLYFINIDLFVTNDVAGDGIKIDFDGGTATASDFRAHCTAWDTALLLSAQTTALATDFTIATVTGNGLVKCSIAFAASGTGTFIPRFAEVASTVGTGAVVHAGSYIAFERDQ